MSEVEHLKQEIRELDGMLAEVIALAEELAEAAGVQVPWADDEEEAA